MLLANNIKEIPKNKIYIQEIHKMPHLSLAYYENYVIFAVLLNEKVYISYCIV